jgi:hypothetical protein
MKAARRTGGRQPVRDGAVLLLLLGVAGCGGTGTVTGKISYKGQALGGGVVVFTVPGKGSVSSEIGEDGSYTIHKCPTGTAKVTVETKSAQGTAITDPRAPRSAGMKPPAGAVPEGADASFYQGNQKKGKYVPIPDKYNDPAQAGLTYPVHSGSQEINIDLPP